MRDDWMGTSPQVLWMGRQVASVQYNKDEAIEKLWYSKIP